MEFYIGRFSLRKGGGGFGFTDRDLSLEEAIEIFASSAEGGRLMDPEEYRVRKENKEGTFRSPDPKVPEKIDNLIFCKKSEVVVKTWESLNAGITAMNSEEIAAHVWVAKSGYNRKGCFVGRSSPELEKELRWAARCWAVAALVSFFDK